MNLSGNLESGNNSYRNSSDLSDDSSASYHPSQERIIDEDDEEYTEEEADDDREEVFPDMLDLDSLSDTNIEFMLDDTFHPHQDINDDVASEQAGVAIPREVHRLIGSTGLGNILQFYDILPRISSYDDSNDEDEDHFVRYRQRCGRKTDPGDQNSRIVPSDAGRELMNSGDYGYSQSYLDRTRQRRTNFINNLMWRELGIGPRGVQHRARKAISQGMLPYTVLDRIIHYDQPCYSGQFSDDGNFFFACAQDFKVRMYDTSNPYEWKHYKTVLHPLSSWTISDATLSPDNKYLAYSTLTSIVSLSGTDPSADSDPILLDFSAPEPRLRYSGRAIWSLRFSGDGREIVAGTGSSAVVVYDIERHTPVLRLQKHLDDVNAVCFGDSSSPHIIYSGSDDSTIRVWDRRSMGDGREAGVFVGHTEGVTYVDSKGDGRYVLSNGKDQSMKLWDLRKMMTTSRFDQEILDPLEWSTGYDYRFPSHNDYNRHPYDCSVVTFCGHSVLRTLIRCHFSPPMSTNSRYVYTASEDGKVYIYNLDATLAGTIDVFGETSTNRPKTVPSRAASLRWKTCVRDASWHPAAPVIAATSWNGLGMETGTCSVHSWNDGLSTDEGDPPLAQNYEDKLGPFQSWNSTAYLYDDSW